MFLSVHTQVLSVLPFCVLSVHTQVLSVLAFRVLICSHTSSLFYSSVCALSLLCSYLFTHKSSLFYSSVCALICLHTSHICSTHLFMFLSVHTHTSHLCSTLLSVFLSVHKHHPCSTLLSVFLSVHTQVLLVLPLCLSLFFRSLRWTGKERRSSMSHSRRCTTASFCGTGHAPPTMLAFCHRVCALPLQRPLWYVEELGIRCLSDWLPVWQQNNLLMSTYYVSDWLHIWQRNK